MFTDARGYYYRSARVNGRHVREYVGRGPCAELMARHEEMTRERRRLDALAIRREKDDLAALDADLKALSEEADQLARAALLVAGFRQHKRGEWRRKRRGQETGG
jgi:hypothetical protein